MYFSTEFKNGRVRVFHTVDQFLMTNDLIDRRRMDRSIDIQKILIDPVKDFIKQAKEDPTISELFFENEFFFFFRPSSYFTDVPEEKIKTHKYRRGVLRFRCYDFYIDVR